MQNSSARAPMLSISTQTRHEVWHVVVIHRCMMAARELSSASATGGIRWPRHRGWIFACARWPCALAASRTASIRPRKRSPAFGRSIQMRLEDSRERPPYRSRRPAAPAAPRRSRSTTLSTDRGFACCGVRELCFRADASAIAAERRPAGGCPGGLAPGFDRIAAGPQHAAGFVSEVSCFSKSDVWKRAKAHFGAAALPAKPINPGPRQGRSDAQIKAAPVEIFAGAGRRHGTRRQSSRHLYSPPASPPVWRGL